MGNTKPFRLELGFNYTMPEFMILIIEYPHLYGEVILCFFIYIAHDTSPYKNIINQTTKINI